LPTYQLSGPKSPDDLTDRRKELIYCDGYDVTAGVTVFGADPNNNDFDSPVFGQDENLSGTSTNSANVNLTIFEQNEKSNGFLRLIHGMRPSNNPLNAPKQYAPKNLEPVNLMSLRKKNDDTRVIMSRFWQGVQFSAAWPEGAADDKAQRAFTGKGSPCREFDGLLTCDLVVSGESLRSIPYQVPNEAAGTYAVAIEMVKFPGGDQSSDDAEREPVNPVTPDMVSSAGVITWANLLTAVSLDDPGHAHVYYLQSGVTGIPTTNTTIEPEGMRGAPA